MGYFGRYRSHVNGGILVYHYFFAGLSVLHLSLGVPFVWTRFLWKTSKLKLRLSAAHPDGTGGLGFLGKTLVPFGIITFAVSAVVSAAIASRIVFMGAKLDTFVTNYVALLVMAVAVFGGPLLVFWPKLKRLKHRGMLQYSTLADQYTRMFERKWLTVENGPQEDESLLGSGDLQSLADPGNSFEFVRKMCVVRLESRDVIALVVPSILPAVPLLTTVMPLTDILKGLFRLVA